MFLSRNGKNGAGGVHGKVEYLIVGLGNPTPKYDGTRHNAGFVAMDAVCGRYGCSVDRHKFHAMVGETMIAGKRCLLMKPLTFMNNSGEAVEAARSFYKLSPEHIVVMFDDISLKPGGIRIRRKGSDGGHNGIKSIIADTGSDAFPRIKIGVGERPHPDYDLAAWVLSKFSEAERPLITDAAARACEALELIVSGEIDKAMNDFNS